MTLKNLFKKLGKPSKTKIQAVKINKSQLSKIVGGTDTTKAQTPVTDNKLSDLKY